MLASRRQQCASQLSAAARLAADLPLCQLTASGDGGKSKVLAVRRYKAERHLHSAAMDAFAFLPHLARRHPERWRRAVCGVLAFAAICSACPSRADTTGAAAAQFQHSAASRLQAEQQLQAARADVATVQAQTQADAQRAVTLQAQVTAVQRQAAVSGDMLQGRADALLRQLHDVQAALQHEQQTARAQQAAVRARLTGLQKERAALHAQTQATRRRQATLLRQRSALQAQVTQDEAQVAQDHQASDAALVQIYKLSRVSALQLLFAGRSLSDGIVQVEELGLLGERDRALLSRVAYERDVARRQADDLQTEDQAAQALEVTLATDQRQTVLRAGQETDALTQLQRQAGATAQAAGRETAGLQAAIAAVQRRRAQIQVADAAQASALRQQQDQITATRAAEQQRLQALQVTAGSWQARVALATQAEAAAQAVLRRLTATTTTPSTVTVVAPATGGNPFPYGQCTWWALQRRPDLAGSVSGNAWQWASEAAAHGKAEGATPRLGAIAVFQPGVQGADWYGHVGSVTQIGPNGAFAVSEMNFYGWAITDVRWVQTGWGVTFIY